jgi:hypothetical protein
MAQSGETFHYDDGRSWSGGGAEISRLKLHVLFRKTQLENSLEFCPAVWLGITLLSYVPHSGQIAAITNHWWRISTQYAHRIWSNSLCFGRVDLLNPLFFCAPMWEVFTISIILVGEITFISYIHALPRVVISYRLPRENWAQPVKRRRTS